MSVEFEPVRLGRRNRRFDPVAVAAIVVAVGLVAAVLKPWDGEATVAAGSSPAAIADGSPAPVASNAPAEPQASAAVALPRVIRASTASTLSWPAIEPILHRHETWGIRAIVVQPLADTPLNARQRFVERWYPLAADGDDARTLRVDSNDRSIFALGLTFPPAHTPLDVRIWRETGGGLDWVDTESVDPIPSGGAFLYVRPGLVGGLQRPWEPGTYRIDVLVDGSIRRFGMAIPGRFSIVPEGSSRPDLRDLGPPVDATEPVLPDVPIGPFATQGGTAVSLSGEEGEALDEVAAWLDLDPGTDRRPRSFVAATYLPGATRLGVMLPPRSTVMSAVMARLAPEPMPVVPPLLDHTPRDGAPNANVMFRHPGGGAWTPGVYRISVVWADTGGLHDRSWHIDLRPGPLREAPPLLAAARGWARFAGQDGVILGTAEPLVGGSTAGVIELVPLRPDTAGYPAATGVGCGGTVIETNPSILGFAYPADRYATNVRARILRPFLRRDDQVLMTAAFGVPGLILAAPARIGALPAATYEFTVASGDSARTYSLCLGMASFDDG